jgi:hypothetical protein
MDQMILCATAMVALRWWARVAFHPANWRRSSNRVYTIVNTGIAEPHGAPLPWAERSVVPRKIPHRRVRS